MQNVIAQQKRKVRTVIMIKKKRLIAIVKFKIHKITQNLKQKKL